MRSSNNQPGSDLRRILVLAIAGLLVYWLRDPLWGILESVIFHFQKIVIDTPVWVWILGAVLPQVVLVFYLARGGRRTGRAKALSAGHAVLIGCVTTSLLLTPHVRFVLVHHSGHPILSSGEVYSAAVRVAASDVRKHKVVRFDPSYIDSSVDGYRIQFLNEIDKEGPRLSLKFRKVIHLLEDRKRLPVPTKDMRSSITQVTTSLPQRDLSNSRSVWDPVFLRLDFDDYAQLFVEKLEEEGKKSRVTVVVDTSLGLSDSFTSNISAQLQRAGREFKIIHMPGDVDREELALKNGAHIVYANPRSTLRLVASRVKNNLAGNIFLPDYMMTSASQGALKGVNGGVFVPDGINRDHTGSAKIVEAARPSDWLGFHTAVLYSAVRTAMEGEEDELSGEDRPLLDVSRQEDRVLYYKAEKLYRMLYR